jgi:hypothetical protein
MIMELLLAACESGRQNTERVTLWSSGQANSKPFGDRHALRNGASHHRTRFHKKLVHVIVQTFFQAEARLCTGRKVKFKRGIG